MAGGLVASDWSNVSTGSSQALCYEVKIVCFFDNVGYNKKNK